jgi:hypothetical protein
LWSFPKAFGSTVWELQRDNKKLENGSVKTKREQNRNAKQKGKNKR